jgi:CBS domain-containing protein
MLSNPDWRGTVARLCCQRVRQWLWQPGATASCTWPSSWTPTRWPAMRRCSPRCATACHQQATDNDALLARFAAAIDAFGGPAGWWSRCFPGRNAVPSPEKGGHLSRSCMACAAWRWRGASGPRPPLSAYRRWWAWGRAVAGLGEDLQSLHFLMGAALQAGLAEQDTGAAGQRQRGSRSAQQPGARSAQGRVGVWSSAFKALLHQRIWGL